MPDPMTPERLAEIRRRADLVREFGERPTVEASAADVPALLAEVEKLRVELATVLKNYEGLQGMAIRLEAERDEARAAVAEEQRIADERRTELLEERDQARHDLTEAEAERDDARDELSAARRNYASAENENVSLRARAGKAEEERDEAREQVKRVRARHYGVCHGACGLDDACECEERDLVCAECNDRYPCPTRRCLDGTEASAEPPDIETRVHAFFADADQRGVHLDGMTVDELCDAVMAAIRKGPGR